MNPSFRFHAPVKVRYNETDMQGHVNFGHYLFYFDVGVVEYFEAIGYSYQDMLEDQTDLLYVEAHCNYKSPAKWPEIILVGTRVGHVGKRSLRFEFELRTQGDNRLVATGHIAVVTARPDDFELRPIPERMLEAVRDFEGALPRDEASL
jgi:acyl-CoA thioester hydrolase